MGDGPEPSESTPDPAADEPRAARAPHRLEHRAQVVGEGRGAAHFRPPGSALRRRAPRLRQAPIPR